MRLGDFTGDVGNKEACGFPVCGVKWETSCITRSTRVGEGVVLTPDRLSGC